MTVDPTTLPVEDATVGDAMALMDSGRYRTVPLVDGDGRLAGIVHQREVIEYVAESFPQEILNLPPRPHQQMEAPEGA
jgi:CBS domain-containing protein